MNNKKNDSLKDGEVPGRVTHTRAAALSAAGQLPPSNDVAQERQKQPVEASSERKVSDNTGFPQKRVVLEDVTNICNVKKIKLAKSAQLDVSTDVPSVSLEPPQFQTDSKDQILQGLGVKLEEAMCSVNLEDNLPLSAQPSISQDIASPQADTASEGSDHELLDLLEGPDIPNIDADIEDLQLCSFYAADIYQSLRIAELSRRPNPNYMVTVQRDINQNMRGILIDWLIQVSDESEQQTDTLYLAVYLIDWFLSKNCIRRQEFQLLGITCMLIASKFEEIHPMSVGTLCDTTDNYCTKEEVLKSEILVWKSCSYQLCVPTTKHFLRRFLRAAQASYERSTVDLEYLANYLAELTLTNYGFLNFLPSMIAASTVFLARWTLFQFGHGHPWNPTLEHYTSYRAPDLKATVLAIQDLQLNRDDSSLKAVRKKYRHEKYNSVSLLSSLELLEIMF